MMGWRDLGGLIWLKLVHDTDWHCSGVTQAWPTRRDCASVRAFEGTICQGA